MPTLMMIIRLFLFVFCVGALSLKAQKAELILPQLHTGPINSVDLSKNGKWLLTTSDDNIVKVWDVKTGAPITSFVKHKEKVIDAFFFYPSDKDQPLVVSGSADHMCYIFDPISGEVITSFDHTRGAITDIVYNQKKGLMYTSSLEGNTCVWNPKNGKLQREYPHGYKTVFKLWHEAPEDYQVAEILGNGHVEFFNVDKKRKHNFIFDAVHNAPVIPNNSVIDMHINAQKSHLIFLTSESDIYLRPLDSLWTHKVVHVRNTPPRTDNYGFDPVTKTRHNPKLLLDAHFSGTNGCNALLTNGFYSCDFDHEYGTLLDSFYRVSSGRVSEHGFAVAKINSRSSFFTDNLANYFVVLYDYKTKKIVDTINTSLGPTGAKSIKLVHNDSIVLVNENNFVYLYNTFAQKLISKVRVGSDRNHKGWSIHERQVLNFNYEFPYVNNWDLRDLSYDSDRSYNGVNLWGELDTGLISSSHDFYIQKALKEQREIAENEKTFGFVSQGMGRLSIVPHHNDDIISYVDFRERIAVYHKNGGYLFERNFDPVDRSANAQLTSQSYYPHELQRMGNFGKRHAVFGGIDEHLYLFDYKAPVPKNIRRFNTLESIKPKWGRKMPSDKRLVALQAHTDIITYVGVSQDSMMAATCSKDNQIVLWDLEKQEKSKTLSGHFGNSTLAHFIDNDQRLISYGRDGITNVWDLNNGKLIAHLMVDSSMYLAVTPDHYYKGSKDMVKSLYFKIGQEVFPFEQFDLKYHRPDIVMNRLGYADSSLIKAYEKAYEKRLRKMGFTEEMLKDDFHLPQIEIENFEQLPEKIDTNYIDINLNLRDSKYNLDRINIWINHVAVYGTSGIPLKALHIQNHDTTLKLNLAQGENKIQVSVLNTAGAESYRQSITITCNKALVKPSLYLISIGDSKYEDARYDLKYAAKDALNLSDLFKSNPRYKHVHIKTLINQEVTLENVMALRRFLDSAKIDDHVIVFIAGHGVLNEHLDYFFATHDMNFSQPDLNGLPYENLEGLLDGINPLKKLLFIDACHSGEIDKEDVAMASELIPENETITFRAVGDSPKPKIGTSNISELSKSLFSDLRRGTGATIISSAGGLEFAIEGDDWNNGLFTYCLISGIKSGKADLNGDGEIWLKELQTYVQKEVAKLSGGQQKPTSRLRNDSLNYRIW